MLYEFQPMELLAMEQQAIIKTIIKTLDNYYSTSFKEAQLTPRHYDFTSTDYNFSFPSNIGSGLTEQSLQKKVERFLKRGATVIAKNAHYLFDESGDIRAA